jgi:hypothetical protein
LHSNRNIKDLLVSGLLKRNLPLLITGFLIIATANTMTSQEKGSFLDLGGEFFQLKDQKNYGLIFTGGNLEVAYTFEKQIKNNSFSYQAEFGFGPGFSKGIASINFHLKPADLAYCFLISEREDLHVHLGAYFSMNYFLQLYPELQSGHALWFTFYDIGPRLILDSRLGKQDVRFSISTSVFGLVSRPVELNETYYYSLSFGDLIRKVHSNFNAGSYNLMNHFDLGINWKIPGNSSNSLSYQLESFFYGEEAKLNYLVHTVSYRIKIGGKKK